eukprot:4401796-Pyramimonas_sp.AAC.1
MNTNEHTHTHTHTYSLIRHLRSLDYHAWWLGLTRLVFYRPGRYVAHVEREEETGVRIHYPTLLQ